MRINEFFQLAMRRDIAKRSLIIAVVVGTIMNLINQGDAVADISKFELVKCLLIHTVPYFAFTYGAVTVLMQHNK